jgi:hypothetical protein
MHRDSPLGSEDALRFRHRNHFGVTGHVAVAYHAVGGFRHDLFVVTDHAAERKFARRNGVA